MGHSGGHRWLGAENLCRSPQLVLKLPLIHSNTKISSYGQSFPPYFKHTMYVLACQHARHVQLNQRVQVIDYVWSSLLCMQDSCPWLLVYWIKASCTSPIGRQCFDTYLPVSSFVTSNTKFFAFSTFLNCVQFSAPQVAIPLNSVTPAHLYTQPCPCLQSLWGVPLKCNYQWKGE